MTSREILNLKDGEEFYVVLLSSYYQLNNPFLRHYGTIKTTNYQKPLGIFKTKLKNVNIEHKYDWSTVDAYLDTTNFEHLYWRGRFDELPNDKKITDYAQYTSDHVYCMVYDDINKNNTHEHFSNMFFTEEDARLYYNKRLKKFNKDMKTYIAHLKNEIDGAKICIERAQEQIDYYEHIL